MWLLCYIQQALQLDAKHFANIVLCYLSTNETGTVADYYILSVTWGTDVQPLFWNSPPRISIFCQGSWYPVKSSTVDL